MLQAGFLQFRQNWLLCMYSVPNLMAALTRTLSSFLLPLERAFLGLTLLRTMSAVLVGGAGLPPPCGPLGGGGLLCCAVLLACCCWRGPSGGESRRGVVNAPST
jgi:hypothetical protein